MEQNKIDQNPESPVNTPVDTAPAPKAPKKLHHKIIANKKLLALVIVVALLIVVAAVYWFVIKDSGNQNSSANSAAEANAAKKKASSLPPATVIKGNTYLDKASPIADQHVFKNTDAFGTSCTGPNGTECGPSISLLDIKYYQVGTTQDNQKILIFSVPNGIDSANYFALEKTDGSIAVLLQMDPNVDAYQSSFADNVTLDKTTKLNDLNFPGQVTVNGQKLKASYNPTNASTLQESDSTFMTNGISSIRGIYRGDLPAGTVPQKIATEGGLTYYRVVPNDQPNFQLVEIYATYKNLFSVLYNPAGEIASASGNLAVSWTAGENNTSTYFSGGQGCGSGGYVMAKGVNKADLIAAGKTAGGQTVYQLPTSNALVQEIFNDDYATGDSLDDASLMHLNIQQITDKHSYFLAQNGFSEYVLFQRDDMFRRGGCGKPVIYLYPQKTTSVSVKVGAQVTKSSPTYGVNGWKNVIAQPSGSLSYNGAYYPNLFWEGYGDGVYPAITSGTIVKTADAASTVKAQLAQQGLNSKEIADFMDFWGPRLASDKPYTRITWLNTGQMNQLAPLNITPAPQTTIRVFMDSEGLDAPFNLAPQKLSSVKRLGFTVVEWGGLLRSGLN